MTKTKLTAILAAAASLLALAQQCVSQLPDAPPPAASAGAAGAPPDAGVQ
jgi:hypothetical protein